ncbi:hypothetical protein [Vibrio vulnificus]|uniref:hypothetical protein n=1 Tax=Vibrio vulnificus TaxID=672 RepID=UPI0019D4ACC9|nr:hypothetical protein [Vibrio vulnificus]MBN8107733.1 hypothetical protein [Vibrio vulnificus]
MSEQNVKKHNKFFDRAEKRGANVIAFECLECGFSVRNLAPEAEGEVWDSMTFCPSCETAYYKTVVQDDIEVLKL